MRVVFMGTPDFAVPTLEAIIKSTHEVIAVITQPDKPKGRGKTIPFTPVKEKALEYQIPVFQPPKVRDLAFIEQLKALDPEVIVVVAFGQMIPKAILTMPVYGCINVHASLLPKYRGAAPIQWAVIDGEEETGITTMYLNDGLVDTGDMILKTVISIDKKETGGSLQAKLSELGGELLLETLTQLEAGTAKLIPQTEEGVRYAKRLVKSMGCVDWSMEAVQIERLIRGLCPWPSAYTSFSGKMVKLWEADVVDRVYEGSFGEVVEINKNAILVKTGKGTLSITQLQMEGKKRMAVDAFLRGCSIEKGMLFSAKES